MKKIIRICALVLALTLSAALVLTGCGGKTEDGGKKSGIQIAVPNDTTNEARALLLLQTAGLIELNDPTDLAATPKDIKSNPKNLQFKEVEAATVPTVLQDVDIAVINTNYAIGANLSKDLVLVTESADSPYVNIVVVKEGNESSEKTKVLVDAISSQEVKDYIAANFEDIVAV